MENKLTKHNLPDYLAAFMHTNELRIKEVSKPIGCSTASIERILKHKTSPTDEFLKQSGIMISIGYEKYVNLSNAEKEKISETIGAIGGGTLGFGSITAAISASGTVVGLSAAGITSGLAAIGALVGGGMTAGILMVAIIPAAAAGICYIAIKGIKEIFSNSNSNNIDQKWEEPFMLN